LYTVSTFNYESKLESAINKHQDQWEIESRKEYIRKLCTFQIGEKLSTLAKKPYLFYGKSKGKGKLQVKGAPVLNQASRREDVWGNGGIAQRILNLGTR
jgi:hypothetical protein